ncbi:MAG: hypothetical protein AB7Q97_22810 [Gammaproteobacteria bacterium]
MNAKLKTAICGVIAALALGAAGPASADRGGRGDGYDRGGWRTDAHDRRDWRRHHHHNRGYVVRRPVVVAPFGYAPPVAYRPYYYAPPVVAPQYYVPAPRAIYAPAYGPSTSVYYRGNGFGFYISN